MAVVEPYAPCPCGSGQKFKWCCHKVEAQAERAQRLFDSGQIESAVLVLNEGLKKDPENAWLLTRRATYQSRLGDLEAAKDSLRIVLRKDPKHFGALTLLTRLVIASEGPAQGCLQLQHALATFDLEERRALASLVDSVARLLTQIQRYPAGVAHLKLAEALSQVEDPVGDPTAAIRKNQSISLWLKQDYALTPVPQGVPEPIRERFTQALDWAAEGLWAAAAAAFDTLSAENATSVAAERNLGLCRLWLADNPGAAEALRRAIAQLGNSVEAVDLEALCQQIEPLAPDDQIESVQLSWPVRDRDQLLASLRADATIEEGDEGPIDPYDPGSIEVVHFGLLDRPKLSARTGLQIEDVPLYVGRVFVGNEIAGIETYDDGRLDGLIERFTTLADGAIRPAHPKTRVIDKVSKSSLALSWEWQLPDDLDVDERIRLEREKGANLIRNVWPKTPLPFLGGRTPLAAAKAGDAVVPLRAAVLQLERSTSLWRTVVDFASIRAELNLEPEPPVDPETVDIESLPLSRLELIPVERLDDDRLVALYLQARRFVLDNVLEKAARILADRPPQLWEKAKIEPFGLFSDLAMLAAGHDRPEEAQTWIRKGRQAQSGPKRAVYAPMWDMVEVRISAREKPPEAWVPELAVVLDRYAGNADATQAIMLNLVEMGLVRLAPNPDRRGDLLLDSRPLQMLMAEYGPRVTTASGRLGVSASRGDIWTPDQATGSGGGLWTPGSGSGSAGTSGAGDKPKLILPGQ